MTHVKMSRTPRRQRTPSAQGVSAQCSALATDREAALGMPIDTSRSYTPLPVRLPIRSREPRSISCPAASAAPQHQLPCSISCPAASAALQHQLPRSISCRGRVFVALAITHPPSGLASVLSGCGTATCVACGVSRAVWAVDMYLASPHLTSPHLTSPHLASPHLTSPHLTSSHLTSSHLVTSRHISSHGRGDAMRLIPG